MPYTKEISWEDMGIEERNGRKYYVTVCNGRELLTDYEECVASGDCLKFRMQSDNSQMTTIEKTSLYFHLVK